MQNVCVYTIELRVSSQTNSGGRVQSTLFAFSTTATLFQVQTSSKFVTQ